MDLSDKEELEWLARLVSDLREAAPDYEPLVVGALARDLLLHYDLNVPTKRATADVDLAFGVSNWEEFNEIRNKLHSSPNFSQGQPTSHRVIHERGRLPIDLIPFNGVERPDGTVLWPGEETIMGVLGYREARASSINVALPNGQSVQCVSLPMLALLKLFAWADRHLRAPRRDSADFFLILAHYLDGENAERLGIEGVHLLEETDFDHELAGAWFVGRDVGHSVREHSDRGDQVFEVLGRILADETDPNGRLQLIGETGDQAERNMELARHFRKGFQQAAE